MAEQPAHSAGLMVMIYGELAITALASTSRIGRPADRALAVLLGKHGVVLPGDEPVLAQPRIPGPSRTVGCEFGGIFDALTHLVGTRPGDIARLALGEAAWVHAARMTHRQHVELTERLLDAALSAGFHHRS
jgi:hypothetical protein